MTERVHELIHKIPSDMLKLRRAMEQIQNDIDELLLAVCSEKKELKEVKK